MARIKTFNNGPGVSAQILPSDLNTIQDEYELAFSAYRATGIRRSIISQGGAGAGTLILGAEVSGGGGLPPGIAVDTAFYLDPVDFTVPGASATPRVTKLRLRAQVATGGTASGTTWTAGLYPVVFSVAGAGLTSGISSVGTVVAGSTVPFVSPPANTRNSLTADFTAPAAGWYALCVNNSGNSAASASVLIKSELHYRAV